MNLDVISRKMETPEGTLTVLVAVVACGLPVCIAAHNMFRRQKLSQIKKAKEREQRRKLQALQEWAKNNSPDEDWWRKNPRLRGKDAKEEGEGEDGAMKRLTVDLCLHMLREGEITPSQLLSVHLCRALEVHQECNAITELWPEQLKREAAEADREINAWRESRDPNDPDARPPKPFLGLPVSLKDNIFVPGVDSSAGIFKMIGVARNKDDCLYYKLLTEAGAIPMFKTNVPQTLLSYECCNPLWGRTLNPFNTQYTPGGSSGGEAVVLATGGSVIGIGGDQGGSVRIPAHMCGISAIKPSFSRIPTKGVNPLCPGQEGVPSCNGPMGRTVEDNRLMLKLIIDSQQHKVDANVIDMPWKSNEELGVLEELDQNDPHYDDWVGFLATASGPARPIRPKSTLRFGYYKQDGFVGVTPACARAVQETVDALKACGVDVVPFELPDWTECAECMYGITSTVAPNLVALLEGEPIEKVMRPLLKASMLPRWLGRGLITSVLKWLGIPLHHASGVMGPKSATELYQFIYRRNNWRTKCIEAFHNAELDGIIAPAHAFPSIKHDTFGKLSPACINTIAFNVLDWSAGAIPVTKVDKSVDAFSEGERQRRKGEFWFRTVLDRYYNPEDLHGMPVGVQIAGQRLGEEKVLFMMAMAEHALQRRKSRA